MSIIRIDTNTSASDIDEAFLELVTESLASTFRKPKSEILAFINTELFINIAGSSEPAAVVTLYSVDGINGADNKLHSAALFPLLTKYLKINEDRISIIFAAVEPHNMGSNGKTFIQ